ncbi:MAG: hypothetical protein R3190_11270, partial [Thermoanaerobaculia bacterium]|nr:hypothetical protein [Thermoanaerobaculia bacterium]
LLYFVVRPGTSRRDNFASWQALVMLLPPIVLFFPELNEVRRVVVICTFVVPFLAHEWSLRMAERSVGVKRPSRRPGDETSAAAAES